MRSLSNGSYGCSDGALLAADEKINKITTSFVSSPVNIAAFVLLVVILFIFSLAVLAAVGAAPAWAETTGPQWTVTSVSRPTNFKPGDETGDDSYRVTLTNTGGASSDGSPIVVTDELPGGLSLAPTGTSGANPLEGIAGAPRTAHSAVPVAAVPTTAWSFPIRRSTSPSR